MKNIKWDIVKSERLKRTRGVSFEEMLEAKLVAIRKHPKRIKQNIMLFSYKRYIWVVPYAEEKNIIFFKTLYPSRKYTKQYKEGKIK